MKTVIKTGFQSVFRNNLSTWSVLCILLTLSTFFLEYTIAFYRYLSYDTQLESADFCYTISKEDMTVADVNIVKDLLKNGYGKNGYTVIACCEEDSFGNPVYLSEKYYHNSTFRNYNKNHGVFPAEYYTVGNTFGFSATEVNVNKTIETDVVQIDIGVVPDDCRVERILLRFQRPLTQKVCNAVDKTFRDNPFGLKASGRPAAKPVLKNESFIVLNLLFYLLIIVVVSFAIYWINVKSQNYYKTMYVLGYGKFLSLLPVTIICLTAAMIISAIGTVAFYTIFCLRSGITYVGAIYATDYFIVAGIKSFFTVTAILSGSMKAEIKNV